jgi:uncharacterized protein (TIGR02145 family)
LYNWYAANSSKLAPTGWHVPTDAEWDTLQKYLIANGYNWDGTKTGNKIAKAMAAKADWWTSPNTGAIGNDLTKNNRSGFSALPGGFRLLNSGFYSIGGVCYWWSATDSNEVFASSRHLGYGFDVILRDNVLKSCGFSVRLVR